MNEREIYAEALARGTAAERAAFLDGACRADSGLRARIEALLVEHEKLGSFLESPPAAVIAHQSPTTAHQTADPVGAQIGPYKLLQAIGEGGMGTVYMAEQTHPVRRKVALKIIKPGMDSRQVIVRFEAERQALSLMDHPNIARVLDAGTTDNGRPYFVMELVKGQSITQYCDEKRLTPRERLELLLPVCQAIQHAHQKGVIHRDIKPSNILVAEYDQKAVPKVIDFGVAKAISQPLTEKTMFTGYGQIVGTLEYMSPEQAKVNQLDIDTRSDIYSLGVLMYELLTGTTPFDKRRLRSAAWDEMLRMIREEEPPKPSTRLSDSQDSLPSISAQRHTEPAKLTRLVRGELDWIVMKALEKDRARRYETANELGGDIQRYLADEQVQACPPSASYRLKKFARRNRIPVVIATLVFSFVGLLGAGATWVFRDRAVRQAVLEEKVTEAVSQAEQFVKQQELADGRAQILRAEELLGGSGPEELQARIRQVHADIELLRELDAIPLQKADGKDGSLFDLTGADARYGAAFQKYGIDIGELDATEAAARIRNSAIHNVLLTGLDGWLQVKLKDSPERSRLWAVADEADNDAWRRAFRAAAFAKDQQTLKELSRQHEAMSQPPVVQAWVGSALENAGLGQEAVVFLRKAQDRHPGDFWLNYSLGHVLIFVPSVHSPVEAIGYFRAAVALRPESSEAHSILGLALQKSNDHEHAIESFRRAVDINPKMSHTYILLGNSLSRHGKHDEAAVFYRKAIQLNSQNEDAYHGLGLALSAMCRWNEAIDCLQDWIELNPRNAVAHINLGVVLKQQGKLDESINRFRHAIEIDPQRFEAHHNLGGLLHSKGQFDEALACYQTAIKLKPDSGQQYSVKPHAVSHNNLGSVLVEQGKLDEALVSFRRAIEIDSTYAQPHYNAGNVLHIQNKFDEAIACYRMAIQLDPQFASAHLNLGVLVGLQGRWDEAVACYRKAIESEPKNTPALNNLGMIFKRQGKLDEAKDCFRKAIEVAPSEPSPYINLGAIICDQGDPAGAIDLFRKAIRLEPRNANAYVSLGYALNAQGQLEDAIESYRRAIELDPKLATAHRKLGDLLQVKGEWKEAITRYQSAIELDPKHAEAYNSVAWLLATVPDTNLRDPHRAVDTARMAVQLSRENGSIHNTLGVALYRDGQFKEAIAALEKSLALLKDDAVAHNGLFIAMAQWQLGEKESSRQWFEKSVRWMDSQEKADEELKRFRAEAAELLGLPDQTAP